METIIKVDPSELSSSLLEKIKNFIGNKRNVEVTISLKEVDLEYKETLDRSLRQAESNDVISFTMEEFIAYNPKK